MRNPFVHGTGGVFSADIAVPDHERELAFYAAILTTGDKPLWRDDLMNNLGTPIIGLGARTPEYESLPLQWMPHIQVADVAASAACAIEMGGQKLMHGKDDHGQSLWAVLVDPDGAAFGIIPVVPEEPEQSNQSEASEASEAEGQHERQGHIAWLSLAVPDAEASRDFYQQVTGWQPQSIEFKESEELAKKFEMLTNLKTSAAEIHPLANKKNAIPSVWLIHLPVDDLEESLKQVTENDGQVITHDTEQGCAVICDPAGIFLALRAG